MNVPDAPPDILSVGPVHLVRVRLLGQELALSEERARRLLDALESLDAPPHTRTAPVLEIHGVAYVNLHAVIVLLHRLTDPTTPLDRLTDLTKFFENQTREALRSQLRKISEALLKPTRPPGAWRTRWKRARQKKSRQNS